MEEDEVDVRCLEAVCLHLSFTLADRSMKTIGQIMWPLLDTTESRLTYCYPSVFNMPDKKSVSHGGEDLLHQGTFSSEQIKV